MFKEFRKKKEAKRYKECKEIIQKNELIYDVDILLFVALYEELQYLESKN